MYGLKQLLVVIFDFLIKFFNIIMPFTLTSSHYVTLNKMLEINILQYTDISICRLICQIINYKR